MFCFLNTSSKVDNLGYSWVVIKNVLPRYLDGNKNFFGLSITSISAYIKHSQTCLNNYHCKMATFPREPMLSLPKPIPIRSFLCKLTFCLKQQAITFFVPQMKKESVWNDHHKPLPSKEMRSNAYKIKVKVFSVKQKANQIPLTTIEKNQILSLQENSLMFLQTINFK